MLVGRRTGLGHLLQWEAEALGLTDVAKQIDDIGRVVGGAVAVVCRRGGRTALLVKADARGADFGRTRDLPGSSCPLDLEPELKA
jgi:hypothetical protein